MCSYFFRRISTADMDKHLGMCPVPTCGKCGERFAFKQHLDDHMKEIHRKRPASDGVTINKKPRLAKRFTCGTCLEKFGDRNMLIEHKIAVHSNPADWEKISWNSIEDPDIRVILDNACSLIEPLHHVTNMQSLYNFTTLMNVDEDTYEPHPQT